MLLVALGSGIWSIAGSYLSAVIGMGFGRDTRDKVFSHVEGYSLHEFDQIGTASLITRTTNDITQVQTLLVMGLRFIVSAPIMCIGGIIMAYSKDPGLTRILAVVLPLMMIIIALVAVLIVPLFRSMQIKLDKVNLVLRENLTGIRVIRAFNRLERENERFGDANLDLTDTAIRINKIMAGMQPIMMLFMIIMMGYAVIKVFFANLKRGGILLIQIAVGSLYMFSVPRGYIDGFTQWCKQIIGLCQLLLFLRRLCPLGRRPTGEVRDQVAERTPKR
jgi:ATP-binding cassette subfamily B protein